LLSQQAHGRDFTLLFKFSLKPPLGHALLVLQRLSIWLSLVAGVLHLMQVVVAVQVDLELVQVFL
jgi:hypothetical protein